MTPFGEAAGMGTRLLAYLIDVLIVGVGIGILYAIAVALFAGAASTTDEYGNVSAAGGAGLALVLLVVFVIIPAVTIGYQVVLIALRGATLGKQAMKIKVVRATDGQIPGWGPAFIRWLVPYGAGVLTCGLGELLVFISPVFDQTGRLQGWHDRAAKTFVVKV